MPDPSPKPAVGTQVWPSSSVYDVLHVGEVKVSCAEKVLPVTRSVNPIGSWSAASAVGACDSRQNAFGEARLHESSQSRTRFGNRIGTRANSFSNLRRST